MVASARMGLKLLGYLAGAFILVYIALFFCSSV